MIINDLSGSDSEFWNDFEKVPVMQPPVPGAVKENEAKVQTNFFNKSNVSSPIKPNVLSSITWAREYFEDKISRIREAKGPEIERKTIKAENKLKKFYSEKIEFLRVKYITDFNLLMNEFNDLKQELVVKDEYINQLVQILAESNLIATETMIKTMKNKKIAKPGPDSLELQVLAEEVQSLRGQVSNLKDLCLIYQKDTDTAKKAHEDSVKAHQVYKESSDKQVKSLQETVSAQEQTLVNFKSSKQVEIEELKGKFKVEMSIMEEVQNRQSLYIGQLQEELKNAKAILTNKYLRNKYYDSIKEYQDEISRHSKAQLSQSNSVHKRAQSAAKDTRRRDSSAGDSFVTCRPHPPKKIVRGFKPIFAGQLQGSIFNTWSND